MPRICRSRTSRKAQSSSLSAPFMVLSMSFRLLFRRALRSAFRTRVGVPFTGSALSGRDGVSKTSLRFDFGVVPLMPLMSPVFFKMDRGVPFSTTPSPFLLDGVCTSASSMSSSSRTRARAFRGVASSVSSSPRFLFALTISYTVELRSWTLLKADTRDFSRCDRIYEGPRRPWRTAFPAYCSIDLPRTINTNHQVELFERQSYLDRSGIAAELFIIRYSPRCRSWW